jgi:hypothetical protein
MDYTMERKSLLKRTWILPVGVAALIGGHVIFFYIVKQSASRILGSGAVISGLVLLVIAKHLGLLAALFRPVYNLFWRRPEVRDHTSARSLITAAETAGMTACPELQAEGNSIQQRLP